MIYLDNAATTWPKPESVYRATDKALRSAANPGRGGHRFSRSSAKLVLEGRETVARFFGVRDSRQIIFTSGATESLNTIINGLIPRVKKILSAGFEHNALWRPLENVARQGVVQVEYIDPMRQEGFDWSVYLKGLEGKPDLVTITHASNVTGQVFPLAEMVKLAKDGGALTCVDISQTAGVLSLNFEELNLDFAAFPGHKGLLGPPGIGGFYISPEAELVPQRLGGTGGNSVDAVPPEHLPERYESGTINTPGVAGLAAGVSYLEQRGLREGLEHELGLRN
jgi:selenocysteine lyase/cysteine desulfurase